MYSVVWVVALRNPDIDALGFPGFSYNERADNRSWKMMLALFDEVR